ncbi:outer membrane protein [Bartonella sp. B17]
MNMKWLITASAFVLASVSVVQAADVMIRHEPTTITPVIVSPAFSWAGFYFGGQVGNLSSKMKMDFLEQENKIPINKDSLPKFSGFVGGFYAGSNVDLGNGLVLGVDTDIVWADKSDTKTISAQKIDEEDHKDQLIQILEDAKIDIKDDIKVGDKQFNDFTFKAKWAGATRVRIGFAADRILPYIAGGIAYTQIHDVTSIYVKGKDTDQVIASGDLSDETKWLVGYTLGGGIDFSVTDNVIVRAEYRYSDFGKKKLAKNIYEATYKTNDFRVGVAYKF